MIFRVLLILCAFGSFLIIKGQNLTIYKSPLNIDETAQKVIEGIQNKGLLFFEIVAHDKIAAERGQKIAPTRSILFEDPDLTTKLIICQQTTAIDLPLEFLVWEEEGDVYIGFIDPKFMKKRFLVIGCDETIQALTKLMIRLANDAIRE